MERVTANDPADTSQRDLIRMHLPMEAGKCAVGDFSDPAATHGEQTPGRATLRAGAPRRQTADESLPNGTQLWYSSTDPVMVAARHEWFAAQRMDPGAPSP